MWAAHHGARHVYSIEASDMALVQSKIIADNHLSEKITVLQCRVEELTQKGTESFYQTYVAPVLRRESEEGKIVDTPFSIDFIISEWMGFYLVHEDMLSSVIRARDFFLQFNRQYGEEASLQLIPSHAQLWVAPMNLNVVKKKCFYDQYDSRYNKNLLPDSDSDDDEKKNTSQLSTSGTDRDSTRKENGIQFHCLAELEYQEQFELNDGAPVVYTIPPASLLHPGQVVREMDLLSLKEGDLDRIESITPHVCFDFTHLPQEAIEMNEAVLKRREVLLDGFAFWFQVSFTHPTVGGGNKTVVLDTSPASPPTHWKQTISLLPEELRSSEVMGVSRETEPLTVKVTLAKPDEAAEGVKNENRFYAISVEFSPDD
ncbi:arginine N-methyltransferase, type I [Angomonas deanei]|uniref:Protein arginine N-methyltransferase domain-containing protein n=1 Tax=Angomonas deanei TaxID=59799 RepID=A0A7G2CCK1_9TRYP|nr:arginine N-methyltransferase, type I [Angomonas deanei]CAD2217239.1 hypothetical protein, conserved [Angomonas deanei]|eukprot:EPY38130.1 arginine N-methyltransferase, type I [Angomonas deanei]